MSKIILPKDAPVSDATVHHWHKAVGQTVVKGELLADLHAVRSTIQILSDRSGKLNQVLAGPGATVKPGDALAILEDMSGASGTPACVPSPASLTASTANSKSIPQAAQAASQGGRPMGKVVPILMPKAGNSMEEGTVVAWRIQVGQEVKIGDIIMEVETDKATMEVEATDAGRLARIVADKGQIVPVLQPVGYLADSEADLQAYLSSQDSPAPGSAPASTSGSSTDSTRADQVSAGSTAGASQQALVSGLSIAVDGRIKASPAARKIAAQRQIDLAAVGAGTGPGGRILSTDLPTALTAAKGGSAVTGRQTPAAAIPAQAGASGRICMSSMRKAIARNLALSKQTIPHFYIELTIDAQPLMDFYRQQKAQYPCSINDVLVLACARGIMQFPAFRQQIDGDDLVQFPQANIGVAVGTDQGLVVPVLVGVEKMSLPELAQQTRKLVENARAGKIAGIGKGVFTISNLGMFGTERFSAIINPPEAAILAVGAIREEVIVCDGAMRPGRRLTMTLSCDHRVIDGLMGAQFLAKLKEWLQAPANLLSA